MDRVLTTAAAIVNAPPARSSAGESKVASRSEDDSFARLLDAEREDREAIEQREATDAQAVATPTPAAQAEKTAPAADRTETDANAAAEFRAELNTLTTDASAPGTQTSSETVTDPIAAQPAAVAAAATQAAQTSAAAGVLANVSVSGDARAAGEATETKAEATVESNTTDPDASGAETISAAPIAVPAPTVQTAATIANAAEPVTAISDPAAPKGIEQPVAPGIPAAGDDEALAGATAPKSDGGSQTSPAQPNAHAPAHAATAANAQPQSAATGDSASAAAIPPGGNAPPPAATAQPAASNPLTDASRAAATPPALQSAPAATIEVYSRIIERADGRAQRFEVRLDPVELGRVDVRIEIGADRKVHAVLAAHDSAALTDLMRGQRALERALSDAGIDLADKGIRFELSTDTGRGGASQQRDGDSNGRPSQPDVWRNFETTAVPVNAETAAIATPKWRTQRLDLVA